MKITIWFAGALMCFPPLISGAQTSPRTGADNRYCKPGNVSAFGEKDGPAALPQSCFYTALSATPSPGKEIAVSAGSLRRAIVQARCGDTLVLHAGDSYDGPFEFPPKGCDDTHWVTVRTDGELPQEGTRISPCYAGLASLKGRPAFACTTPKKEMATLVVPPRGSIKVADHYRFIGLEITRTPGGGIVYNLINAQNGNKIIFDRMWMHGTAEDETTRAVSFPGATSIAAIDSYFSDLHCIARTGSCTDSQTLWAGAGSVAGGTYKIVNNYLESAGEGVMFGGGGGSATPADIEIRRNYFHKPPSWNPLDPNFIGITYIVKNNLEFKNGSRALVEGNVLENSWGGFTQMGFQLLLTPKNQNSHCPECVVHDITVRNCILLHSGSGMVLANSADGPQRGISQGMSHVSIHDVIIDDIDAKRYAGNGFTFQISNDGSPLRDVTIDHVTVAHPARVLFVVGGPTARNPMSNIRISNSILDVGAYEVVSTGAHGEQNCAFQRRSPKDIFDGCWKPYLFTNNVLIRPHGGWPSGNMSARDMKAIGFAAVQNDSVLDFHLKSDSPYRRKGEGQTDPGADAAKIAEETAGVTE